MDEKSTGERLETFIYDESTIEHLHRYALSQDYVKDKIVLDIACGEGYGANLLAQKALSVTGVDIDQAVIDSASKKYNKANLKFITGRAEDIPFPDHTFDLVVSFETLEHLAEHEQMFHEIKRVLKSGGLLIISTPEKTYYSDLTGYNNPFHKKELHEKEFLALINRFFKYSHCLYQRLFLASVILLNEESEIKIYDGDYNGITFRTNIDPIYLIAIASDIKIEKPSSSLFDGKATLETALRKKEVLFKKTITYKIGHLLLLPFKMIKKRFKN